MNNIDYIEVVENPESSPLSVKIAGDIHGIDRFLDRDVDLNDEEEFEHIYYFLEDYQRILQYRLNILASDFKDAKADLISNIEQENTNLSADIRKLSRLNYKFEGVFD